MAQLPQDLYHSYYVAEPLDSNWTAKKYHTLYAPEYSSLYLLFLGECCQSLLRAVWHLGLAMFLGDVVETTKCLLKQAFKEHS